MPSPEKYLIGLDPGVDTGYSAWNGNQLVIVSSDMIHRVMAKIKKWNEVYRILVRMEDARKRKWFGQSAREQLQGAGSIKRDCKIWEDFFKDNKIAYELVAPKNNKTKMSADTFKRMTGYKGLTNEHGRDAACLVFGYNCKSKFDLHAMI